MWLLDFGGQTKRINMSIKNPDPDPDPNSDPEQVFLPSRGSCISGSFVSRIWKFAPDFDELFGHPLRWAFCSISCLLRLWLLIVF